MKSGIRTTVKYAEINTEIWRNCTIKTTQELKGMQHPLHWQIETMVQVTDTIRAVALASLNSE